MIRDGYNAGIKKEEILLVFYSLIRVHSGTDPIVHSLQVHVDPEDKTTYPIQVSGSNYKTNALFVNESGLYALILSSKLPQAKAFKRWVTSEVLPQIRQTGGYIPTKDAPRPHERRVSGTAQHRPADAEELA